MKPRKTATQAQVRPLLVLCARLMEERARAIGFEVDKTGRVVDMVAEIERLSKGVVMGLKDGEPPHEIRRLALELMLGLTGVIDTFGGGFRYYEE